MVVTLWDEKETLNKKEAEELLKIIDEEDKKVQKKLRKGENKPPKKGKDW